MRSLDGDVVLSNCGITRPEIDFIKIIFKVNTSVKDCNLCIRTVLKEKCWNKGNIYLAGNFHFIIKLTRKYKNICSYFYCMTDVKIFFVDVLSIKMELKCLFIFEILAQDGFFLILWINFSFKYLCKVHL